MHPERSEGFKIEILRTENVFPEYVKNMTSE